MTFQYQGTLLKLPIPSLAETCTNYLKALQPLQTEYEHRDTVAAVEAFVKSGTGEYLDTELRSYASTRNSYVEQFWYDSYLNYDNPVVLNLNPFFLLEDDPFNNAALLLPQIKRATTLTLLSLKFIQALKRETLPSDLLKNGKALCMFQYKKLFGALRVPTNDGCVMQSDVNSTHIIVLSKSQFYWFDVLDHEANLVLSELELMVNFTSIVRDSLNTSPIDIAKSSFGVLTTENRRTWLGVRAAIQLNATNQEILQIIDTALFVLCLDDIECEDLSILSKNMLCGLSVLDKGIQVGTCTNRWYDKLQIIVTKNGKAGVNFEHTGVDGHTVLRFVLDVYTDSILAFAQSINGNTPLLWKEQLKKQTTNGDKITVPRKLEWDLTPDLSLALRFGETRLSDLINQNEFRHLEFKTYGSTLIKKWKFSPDAFVQMAFQATYYALYGKVECTYEPAMTKQFYHGRTEAIRTVSQESNLFVRKFFDSSVLDEVKLGYLLKACEQHSDQTRRCSQGRGVDRHLFGLFSIWKRYFPDSKTDSEGSDETVVGDAKHNQQHFQNLPAIFADAGWDKLNNTIMSTSNCGNPALRLFGFGPTLPNGFGIGYIIKDDSISICASSKHRQTERFLVTLESYLVEIQRMTQEVHAPVPPAIVVRQHLAQTIQQPAPQRAPVKSPLASPVVTPASATSLLLGGYGYFDMGEDDIKSRGQSPEPPFLNRTNTTFSVREIGKKLRLSEY